MHRSTERLFRGEAVMFLPSMLAICTGLFCCTNFLLLFITCIKIRRHGLMGCCCNGSEITNYFTLLWLGNRVIDIPVPKQYDKFLLFLKH